MQNIFLAIHILACIALVVVVLLQRSEGGALGIGGGSGSMFSGRGAAGALVRTTMIFGGIFLFTSLVLTTMAARDPDRSLVEEAVEGAADGPGGGDVLDPETDLLGDPLARRSTEPSVDPLAPVETTPEAPESGETSPVDPFADDNTGNP